MNTRRKLSNTRYCWAPVIAWCSLVAGCGGSSGGGVTPTPPPPPPPIVATMNVVLSAADVVAGSAETGTASGVVTYNATDAQISATVTLSGVSADSVTINQGAAGAVGAERFALAPGASTDEWALATTTLAAADAAALESGSLYLQVLTAAAPDGALRGQILPAGVIIERIALEARQVTSGSNSSASGIAWITVDETADSLTIHAVTENLNNASSALLRDALAGDSGPVLETLVQDPADDSHWLLEAAPITPAIESSASTGSAYVELSTTALPDGALRGQFLPDTHELVITSLEDNQVVMGGQRFMSKSSLVTTGHLMTTIGQGTLTSHVNLFSVSNADSVSLRRAPAGQNGPVIAEFQQDINDAAHWSLPDQVIDPALGAGLDNQTVYVQVTTPANPNGVGRGQIVTAASMMPPDESAFVITQVAPENAEKLSAFPAAVIATFNRPPLASTVSPSSVQVEASGQDGSFNEGNESMLTPAAVTANGNEVIIDLGGVVAEDDVYRVSILGDGPDGILDASGIPLDGDMDGSPGGIFESAFEVEAPPPPVASFADIQDSIFRPTCAVSGCHTGSNPPDGLSLAVGTAYANIVNVASVQMPALSLINPGNPNDSYLVRKVQGTDIVANRMPLNADPLSQAQIDLIRQWVTDGAPDN